MLSPLPLPETAGPRSSRGSELGDRRVVDDPFDLDMPHAAPDDSFTTTAAKPEYSSIQSSKYWFDDGSIIARLRNHNFKVHKSLLVRHSPFLEALATSRSDEHDLPAVHIPEERATIDQFTVLLGHLYHDRSAYNCSRSYALRSLLLRAQGL